MPNLRKIDMMYALTAYDEEFVCAYVYRHARIHPSAMERFASMGMDPRVVDFLNTQLAIHFAKIDEYKARLRVLNYTRDPSYAEVKAVFNFFQPYKLLPKHDRGELRRSERIAAKPAVKYSH